ncbi:MAG: nuclear transport factor 2 family protein [Candidatus Binataceae bacterium]
MGAIVAALSYSAISISRWIRTVRKVFASFFTADGVFHAVYGEYKGRQAIAEFIREHIRQGNEDNARHLLSNFTVLEAENAPVIGGYVTKIRLQPAPITIIAYAGLQATVTREGANWRIKRLELSITLAPA